MELLQLKAELKAALDNREAAETDAAYDRAMFQTLEANHKCNQAATEAQLKTATNELRGAKFNERQLQEALVLKSSTSVPREQVKVQLAASDAENKRFWEELFRQLNVEELNNELTSARQEVVQQRETLNSEISQARLQAFDEHNKAKAGTKQMRDMQEELETKEAIGAANEELFDRMRRIKQELEQAKSQVEQVRAEGERLVQEAS